MQKFNPLFVLLSFILIIGCAPNNSTPSDFEVNIRLSSDPANLSPMIGSLTAAKTQILNLIHLPLANYDPESLELSPVLIEELSPGIEEEDENGIRSIKYDYTILEEAQWEDGKPVTAHDYLFTVKATKHPQVNSPSWRGILSTIQDIGIDQNDPKKFSVTIKPYFHLAREASTTFEIYPRHIYDPEDVLGKYEFATFNDPDAIAVAIEQDSSLSQFANSFNSPAYTQEIVSGCGPYQLSAWEIDQYLALERKENYWGSKYPERYELNSNPKKINFRIIADENAAITLLKEGSIDLMEIKDANNFDNLKSSEEFDKKFSVHNPSLLRLYYISLNNRKPELNDKNVRRALAHLVDVENIINTLENGYGNRQVGAILNDSPFFNDKLNPLEFDPQKAIELLEAAQWKDSNNNGTRDKVVNGELVELEIDYLASQSPLGQKVGLLFQDAAKEAGVAVNMQVKEGRQLNEALRNHNFEASASAIGYSNAAYDPYQRWHSDNAVLNKGNFMGYVSKQNDSIIDKIRTTDDLEERSEAYDEFQELMYDEQPVIFLYSPTQKYILKHKYSGIFSSKRPGYAIKTFKEI